MKPIYEPKGRAREYGEYALNIYTGCPHRCEYCYSPKFLHMDKEKFHSDVRLRDGLLPALERQLKTGEYTGKTIHLCFTCDPYPLGYDSTPTREVIRLLKHAGAHVQILTKNGADAERDFDLLDKNDLFGVSYAGYGDQSYFRAPKEEPESDTIINRLAAVSNAFSLGIRTWVSCEPVINELSVIQLIRCAYYVNLWKIGKMNYYPSDVDWDLFGRSVEATCKAYKRNYYIKNDLRACMK